MTLMMIPASRADEGMWIPMLLDQLNIRQMKDLGCRLSADDIYSINHASLKDAIVQFGTGCTGEIISGEGLLLTNHHCGLGAIQRNSSLEHNYLKDGFWAMTREEELPNPGVTVTLLVRMEDVTDKALEGVTEQMNMLQRQSRIKRNIDFLEKDAEYGTHYTVKIRPFFYGNKYYMFVTEVFKDIRLVGAPPEAIGQFGGDTDNWMWPRHGADFSLFRIYSNKNNEPADYSADNVPYVPKRFLSISLKGYNEGDFTFLFGYPGTTREYLTAAGVDLTANIENPVRIGLRQKKLDIMNKAMEQNQQVRIQYTSKQQAIANGWKKMMGETKGIARMDGVGKKKEYEIQFQKWADSLDQVLKIRSQKPSRYGSLLASFDSVYAANKSTDIASVYLNEAGLGIEIIKFASGYRGLVKLLKKDSVNQTDLKKVTEKLLLAANGFYKDYNLSVDKQIMLAMLTEMIANLEPPIRPAYLDTIREVYGKSPDAFVEKAFNESIFADSARFKTLLRNYTLHDGTLIANDPVFRLCSSIYDKNESEIQPLMSMFNARIDSLQRIYMLGQMEREKERHFYPDANSSLRIAYGKIGTYAKPDGTLFETYTTYNGILAKENPAIYDYAVDPKLKKLFRKKDFGPYADASGTLRVAFIASNHTTGGNSGSPVLNADGQLIGVNFDRNWEGTMSDLIYDPAQCRNITLDIRYCLFLVDKYAGAGHLLKEMTILN